MDKQFTSYLFLIVILAAVVTGFLLLLIVRLKKRKEMSKKTEAIDGGNVSVFFDKGNNITIIPYAKDKYGVGRAVGTPLQVKWPYNAASIGSSVRRCMKLCATEAPCSNEQLMTYVGISSWKEFSAGKRNISVHYHEAQGVAVNSTTRRTDGSYQFNHIGFERVVSKEVTDKQLGEAVLDLLGRCKA